MSAASLALSWPRVPAKSARAASAAVIASVGPAGAHVLDELLRRLPQLCQLRLLRQPRGVVLDVAEQLVQRSRICRCSCSRSRMRAFSAGLSSPSWPRSDGHPLGQVLLPQPRTTNRSWSTSSGKTASRCSIGLPSSRRSAPRADVEPLGQLVQLAWPASLLSRSGCCSELFQLLGHRVGQLGQVAQLGRQLLVEVVGQPVRGRLRGSPPPRARISR